MNKGVLEALIPETIPRVIHNNKRERKRLGVFERCGARTKEECGRTALRVDFITHLSLKEIII